jgi:hypothetical protein
MQKSRLIFVIFTVVLLFLAASPCLVAGKPGPTQPPAIQIPVGSSFQVDGIVISSEVEPYVAKLGMFIAGDSDKPQVANAYLAYDLSNSIMYLRVEVDLLLASYDQYGDNWISFDGISHKIPFIQLQYLTNVNGEVYGFEASISKLMAPNVYYDIIIHINVQYQGSATAATIGFQGKVGQPVFVVPETLVATTIVSMFGALGAVFGIRRYHSNKK